MCKGIKRFFSTAIAVVLIAGLMPLLAFAGTNYPSAPVDPPAKHDIIRTASGYTGTYDGKPHGISVNVSQSGNGATVKYGTAEGVYDLDASPTLTNVADSPLEVYYQIEADGHYTITGKKTVEILPANPTVPIGVTAYYGEPLGSASLPDGWSWVDDNSDVGDLGTKTFLANYTATDPNFKDMSGVAIPVTVVERNHSWGDASYEWTFDNSSVTANHTCSVCDIDETETVPASSSVTKQPTCSSMGETTYVAEFANTAFAKQTKTVVDVPVNHDAHSWGDWVKVTEPTCEGEGKEERVCSLDVVHKETRTVAALGHDWDEISWTTEDDEYIHWKRSCKREGCDRVVEWKVKKGETHIHHPVIVEGKDPTCEAPGNIEHVLCTGCSHRFTGLDCKEEMSDNEVRILPLGHAMSDWVQTTAASCSSMGESKRTCGREGCPFEETRDDALNPYAHEWGEWTQKTPPTCTKAGEDTRVCTHDSSHTEKRVGAAATGHVWTELVYTWADDNASVTATRICKHDDSREIETAAVRSDVTQEPTCTSKGKTTYTATFTNESFTAQSKSIENVDIDPDAHDWGGWVATEYPTCTQAGTEEHVCAHDASHRRTRTIPIDPDAHDWGEWTVVRKATTTAEGLEQHVCKHNTRHVEKRDIAKLPVYEAKDATGNAVQALNWQKGSGKNLDLTINRSEDDSQTYGKFTGIVIDGTPVADSNYNAESGSLKLSIKADYLESLAPGDHSMKVNFKDGSASLILRVLAATPANAAAKSGKNQATTTAPKTGDESNMLLWFLLICASLFVMFRIISLRNRRFYDR